MSKPPSRPVRPVVLAAVAAALVASPAHGGPPFLSDDPEPTDRGHWEIYNFVTGARSTAGVGGAGGLDLNYGAAPDLQITAVLPLGFDDRGGRSLGSLRAGFGDIELAAKYRFIHQAEASWRPDISVFPRLYTPSGSGRFGSDHVALLLPVWAQKDFGSWSVFGGGGYEINPGGGQRNFWQGGVALARTLSKRLQVGGELFAQSDDAPGEGGFATLDFGVAYKVFEHWSLLASAGPSWNHAAANGAVFYVSLKADY